VIEGLEEFEEKSDLYINQHADRDGFSYVDPLGEIYIRCTTRASDKFQSCSGEGEISPSAGPSIIVSQKINTYEVAALIRLLRCAVIQLRGRRYDDWLFPSRSRPGGHVSTRQYARLVDKWVSMIELEPRAYGTHSLRRTKVALIYKKTGNLRACQLLLGHRKLESTVRYLGIEVDDALEMSEAIDL
jgi:hypothetical protein